MDNDGLCICWLNGRVLCHLCRYTMKRMLYDLRGAQDCLDELDNLVQMNETDPVLFIEWHGDNVAVFLQKIRAYIALQDHVPSAFDAITTAAELQRALVNFWINTAQIIASVKGNHVYICLSNCGTDCACIKSSN